MELVYLWVEEYKNIRKQGFNFSPLFRCDYDPDNNKLTIVENKEYVDFFPENINVTAIVGKNGSGKSSILEFLRKNWCELSYIVIYTKQREVFCEYKTNKRVEIECSFDIKFIELDKCNALHNSQFFPKIIDIANDKKIGKDGFSLHLFGDYIGITYGSGWDGRENVYNMTQARFFVPRYTNIALDKPEFFESLDQMYQFDTLRLILRNNSTEYLEKKETFGANIHTLLSDSFFMESGLMGEFARSKIDDVIKFHKKVEEENKKDSSDLEGLKREYSTKKEKFWQIQQIIGEDYLKQVIKNHLVEIEKILLGKDAAREEEIKRTEVYLEKLKSDKSN